MSIPDFVEDGAPTLHGMRAAANNIQRLATTVAFRIKHGESVGLTQDLLRAIMASAENIKRGLED